MILAPVHDDSLLHRVREAALPGEEVVSGWPEAVTAAQLGFPRVAISDGGRALLRRACFEGGVPYLELPPSRVARLRRLGESSGGSEDLVSVMRGIIASAAISTWVDRVFGDLGRACGHPLPDTFKAFARRPLEYPYRHRFLASIGAPVGISPNALKQRFRRGGLPSPSQYLAWLRLIALCQLLSDPAVSTGQAAHRLGYSSSGNLCRAVEGITGLRTRALRSSEARWEILVRFSSNLLARGQLEAWREVGAPFREAAA